MYMKKNNKGFTLAELLIVVAVIAVLVAVAIPTFANQLEKSRQAVDIANLRGAYAAARLVELNGDIDGVKLTKVSSNDDKTGFTPQTKPTGYANSRVQNVATGGPIILQFWYHPGDGTLKEVTYGESNNTISYAVDDENAKDFLGEATTAKLYADTSNLPNAKTSITINPCPIIYYTDTDNKIPSTGTAKFTLKATLTGAGAASGTYSNLVGTVEKAILVVFEKNAGGVYELTEVSYQAKPYGATS